MIGTHPGTYIAGLILQVGDLVNLALPIAAGAAVLVFFWGLATYIFKPDKVEIGRSRMVWGIIALFVMVSVWGLVSLLSALLGLGAYEPVDPGVKNPIPSSAPKQVCEYNAAIGGNICYYQ